MLKKGRKILMALIALVAAVALFAACGGDYSSEPLTPDTSTESVASNGGFVVETGDYVYFINGVESYSADNTYGSPVKGSLMRIAKSDLDAGNYAEVQTVVPQLIVSQDFTSGFYIYGDRVYYASPTTARNPEGDVENSYIDFKSSALDGSSTMSGYYVRMSDNATVFRYVQDENGTVYLLYVDSANTEIHSYNTATGVNTTLVAGYQSYVLNSDDKTDPDIYYTMQVYKNSGYSESNPATESYQQVYRVSAFATESPYEMDLSQDYTDKDTGNVLEYTNLGTLVLDGIGRANQATPFNHDVEGTQATDSYYADATGVTYTLVKYTNGGLYYTNSEHSANILYRLPVAQLDAAIEADTWNSVTGNANNTPNAAGDINVRIAIGTTEASSSAIFYEADGAQYYIYASGSSIVRVKVDENAASYKGETVYIARSLTGGSSDDSSDSSSDSSSSDTTSATLQYTDGEYLYFTQSDNGIYRVNYKGTQDDYLQQNLNKDLEFTATRYLDITHSSSWYAPEIVHGYLFFANAGSYAETYVFVMKNPESNQALKELNDKYEDVQEVLADISETYADAGNAANYYYYTRDGEILDNEEYSENFTDEDKAVFNAFVNCTVYENNAFDASILKNDTESWNYRDYYFNLLGRMSDGDADTVAESLINDLIDTEETTEETTDDGGWTWQWAALFVPIGAVLIAGGVVTFILIRKKKRARK